MKNIISLVCLYLLSCSVIGQNHNYFILSDFAKVTESSENTFDFCDQVNTTEENIFYSSIGNPQSQKIAHDLFVEADTQFNLEQVIIELLLAEPINNLDVVIWNDDAGKPGVSLVSELAIIPSSQTIVGTTTQGGDVYEVILDLTNPFELIGSSAGTTYWVQIAASNAGTTTTAGWHATTTDIQGFHLAFNQDEMSWDVEANPIDGVYAFIGDCEPILGVNETSLDQASIYPNPTNNILNIALPSGQEIKQIDVFDLVGKNMNIASGDSELNLSELSNGVYLLRITTSEGMLVKKVVKSNN